MKRLYISLLAGTLISSCAAPMQVQKPYYPPYAPINNIQTSVGERVESIQNNNTTPNTTNNVAKTPQVNSKQQTLKPANVVQSPKPVNKQINTNAPKYAGNILIGIKSEFGESDAKNLIAKYNINFDGFINSINIAIANVNNKYSLEEIVEKLSQETIVSFVESDKQGTLPPDKETTFETKDSFSVFGISSLGPFNDKYFDQQYALSAIHAPSAWQISMGSPSVKVAVIDTGVDIGHQDLKYNIHPGYDAFSKKQGKKSGDVSALNYIISAYKHGTHVAGIIAAQVNNGKGIIGVAPNCKIMPIKIFPDTGEFLKMAFSKPDDSTQRTLTSAVADGIVWAVDHGADVINMSLGTEEESQTLKIAVAYALDHNVPVVVAAGNEREKGNMINYLAAIPGVIAVGATDQYNRIASFSNSGNYVSVVAPGFEILSTVPSFLNWKLYTKYSGTSMAAPHVAGVVALLKSINHNAAPAWIKQQIESTALDLGEPGRDDLYGTGIINAYSCLKNI